MSWIPKYFQAFWDLTVEMGAWLLLGFFIAGLIRFFLREEWIQKHLGHRGWRGAVAATLWGIPLPLCSCGVIPVAMAIRRHGASRESTVSFLTSTPQTGADSFLATLGLLGTPIAVIRVAVAFVTGVLTGRVVGSISPEDEKKDATGTRKSCCSGEKHNPEPRTGSCCDSTPGRQPDESQSAPSKARPGFLESMHYGFWTLPRDINKPLIIGLAIGAALGLLGSTELFSTLFERSWTGYVVSALFAIPLYVCSTGSIPMATGLVAMGATPGAAMTFLILGPATNAVTVASIASIIGRKGTIFYLSIMTLVAFATGIALDLGGIPIRTDALHPHHGEEVPWWKITTGILLLALMIGPLLPYRLLKKKGKKSAADQPGEKSCCSSQPDYASLRSESGTEDDSGCCSTSPNSGQCH